MRRVRIDFSSPSAWHSISRASPAAWVLVAAAFGLAAVSAFEFEHYFVELGKFRRSAAHLESAAAARMVAAERVAVKPLPAAQVDAVNMVVAQLNVPWRALYDAIQLSTPSTVALVALDPDHGKSWVRITAEARNSDEMISYIEQMRRNELFTTVTLVRHEIVELDRNRPIRFEVDAQWRVQR